MEQPQTTPMDGASASTEPSDMDPAMGGEEMPPMDPAMGGEEMPPMDPAMGGEEMPPMGQENGGDDSTESIINQLSDEDREAVRAYAESMLKKNGEQPTENGPETTDPAMGGEPMMESAIFTKKQIEMIMENFGPTEDELQKDDKKHLSKKNERTVSKKSPFNSPKFN